MADRTVSVRLQAQITQYQASMAQAVASTKALKGEIGAVTTVAKQGGPGLDALGTAGIAMGGAVALGFGKAVSVAASFEKQMSGVQAVSNASAREMDLLADAAIAAGANTKLAGVSASEAAQAQAELVKAGVSVNAILGGALLGSLQLASAGQLDFARAAEIAAQAMNIFKLEGDDVGHVADLLAAAANKSAADVSGLGDAMRQGGLVAAQTGLSIEETVAALAAFGDSALVGADAGTSLKSALQRLTPQSAEAAGLMDQLGFSAYDAQGNFIGLENLAGELRSSLGGLSSEQRNTALATIFGSDAVRAANVLYEQGADGIKGYITAVDDQGAASRMAAAQVDNLSGDIEALGGALESIMIENGSAVTGLLRGMAQGATDAVSAFGNLPDPMQRTALAGAGLVGTASALAGGFLLVAPRVSAAVESFGQLAGAAPRLAGALKGVTIAAGGIGIVLAGASMIYAATAQEKAKLQRITEELVTALKAEKDGVTGSAEAWLLDELSRTGALEAAERLRIGVDGVVEAITAEESAATGNIDALSRLEEQLASTAFAEQALVESGSMTEEQWEANREASGNLLEVIRTLNPAYADAQREARLLAEAEGELGLAAEDTQAAVAASNESLAAQAEAAEDAADALTDYQEAVGEAFGSFTDSQAAYDTALASLEEGARSYAEQAAANTEDASDSWEDHYTAVELSAAGWIESLEAQRTAQEDWKTNLGLVAQQAGADLAAEMEQWGPEGAEKVALFVNSSDEEMMKLGALLTGSARDGMQDTGAALAEEWAVMEAIGRAGAQATAGGIAEQLGIGADDVARIAGRYGVNLADGINPIILNKERAQ